MDQPAPSNNHGRNRALLILAVVSVIAILAWLTHIYLVSRFYQTTDDAYISSDLVQITSQEPGTVIAVNVDDTQSVERGQLLALFDPADAQVAIASAEAQLARAVRNVRA
ncbi:MAG TPA: biotin/lipoyl-binding protein, partial [Steroidobacteraceae bacterium]